MNTYECNKYLCTIRNVKKTLKKYGVAIIPNILTEEECKHMENGMWEYLEFISQKWEQPINRKNKSSWKNISKLLPLDAMLIQHWKASHSQFVWDVRQNPKVIEVFSHIWKCKPEQLLVSFDGVSYSMPPEVTRQGWHRNNDGLHCDQSFMRNDFECVQSWINAFDTDDGDATLLFLEASHLYHQELNQAFCIEEKNDWYVLDEDEKQFYLDKGCSIKRIKCPKGSLVLWDSRTIHCGSKAFKARVKPNIRCVVYLCYTPRKLATESMLGKRRKAFTDLRTTNHWPHKIKLFSKIPRTYGRELPEIVDIPAPKLTDVGMRLAGF